MGKPSRKDIGVIFGNGTAVDRAVADAFHDAVRRHRAAGVPMARWEDEKTVLVSPFDIPLPEDEADRTAAD
jgi:hypothetical protein